MTKKGIEEIRSKVASQIDRRQLGDAIAELSKIAKANTLWEIGDKVDRTKQNYELMLRYVVDGIADPDRDTIYDSMVIELYDELDALIFHLEKVENPSLYYGTVRLYDSKPLPDRISKLLDRYSELADKMSIFSLVSTGNAEEKSNRKEIEAVQSEIFKAIWTKGRFSSSDSDAVNAAIANQSYPDDFKCQLVSALTMGLMEQFDSRKLSLLIMTYNSDEHVRVTSAALVGMLIGLWLYRTRPLPKKVADVLAAAKDKPSWKSDLQTAFIEIIRARDTERINKKISEEVIPDMMHLRPEIMKKINDGHLNNVDFASLQENPEWQDLMDKNGITDKLKELTEIQMEGGDVMMSTFSHLKQFPFFNEIGNWFLPFNSGHSQVMSSAERMGIVGDMIESASFLCDSDKYSFMFAMEKVPQAQRDMMTSQFKEQSANIYEAMGQTGQLTSRDARRQAVNSYMQNIYRFFKLYSRSDEFFDPFDAGINMISVPALSQDFDDPEMLQVVAEFYFKLGYMRDALDVFKHLESIEAGDASRYQKMGYSSEHLHDYKSAIKYYQKAELLDDRSKWTARRLAASYRAIGDKDMALKYYHRLSADNPDDLSLALLLGYALTENGDYAEAVHQFYKVEFLDEKSQKSWRPLAWTLFLTGDFDNSKKYYAKIAEHNPTSSDYLNMGHVELASGDMRNAVNSYALSIESDGGNKDAFMRQLADDLPYLEKAGVDRRIMPLIADAVMFRINGNK